MTTRPQSNEPPAQGAAPWDPTPSPVGLGGGQNQPSSTAPAAGAVRDTASGGVETPKQREIDNNVGGAAMGLGPLDIKLKRNSFYFGIKHGRKYICGNTVNDSDIINRYVSLLAEAIDRMFKWRIWEPWWIDIYKMEWQAKKRNVYERLRGVYNDDVVNGILNVFDEFISYIDRFREYWIENGIEVKEIIDNLVGGKAEVVIWENMSGLSVYGKNILLNVSKTEGVVLHLVLKDLEGMTIEIPNIFMRVMSKDEYEKFIRELLIPLKVGFAETDESVDESKPVMGTSKPWQAVLWSLIYYGRVHMHIHSVNVNKYDVTVTWHLRSLDHKSLKGFLKDTEKLSKLSREALLAILFTAVLGDGSAFIADNGHYAKPVIEIVMSSEKYKMWKPLLEKLKSTGFSWNKVPRTDRNSVNVVFNGSHAIKLARGMISILPSIIKDVIDALAVKTWINIKQIAEFEPKFRKGMQIIVIADHAFSVTIKEGTVELRHHAKDEKEVKEILEKLKSIYGDEFVSQINVYPEKGGKYLTIVVPMRLIERYDDIRVQVIRVLCQKLRMIKSERKEQIIVKHLTRLTLPIKGGGRGN
ncbi:hypothetical protein [Vulcanisaeta distributa]|uniref:Uncharacterized protein n=1 Tax=Vulcanisaeta distributa (strain DSM 14429 / JCM 11212 / NBRC 100878 / IC-017) TaxID=572478 RepID=E1QSM4_VULDI|nr:hypothetical protein [Vulcanisaeta distributa]ADN49541.1 hypothetical protein Vdis_0128 [Vulcanisaeta distributa DSM 14429]